MHGRRHTGHFRRACIADAHLRVPAVQHLVPRFMVVVIYHLRAKWEARGTACSSAAHILQFISVPALELPIIYPLRPSSQEPEVGRIRTKEPRACHSARTGSCRHTALLPALRRHTGIPSRSGLRAPPGYAPSSLSSPMKSLPFVRSFRFAQDNRSAGYSFRPHGSAPDCRAGRPTSGRIDARCCFKCGFDVPPGLSAVRAGRLDDGSAQNRRVAQKQFEASVGISTRAAQQPVDGGNAFAVLPCPASVVAVNDLCIRRALIIDRHDQPPRISAVLYLQPAPGTEDI